MNGSRGSLSMQTSVSSGKALAKMSRHGVRRCRNPGSPPYLTASHDECQNRHMSQSRTGPPAEWHAPGHAACVPPWSDVASCLHAAQERYCTYYISALSETSCIEPCHTNFGVHLHCMLGLSGLMQHQAATCHSQRPDYREHCPGHGSTHSVARKVAMQVGASRHFAGRWLHARLHLHVNHFDLSKTFPRGVASSAEVGTVHLTICMWVRLARC